jgi:hypothetical protein
MPTLFGIGPYPLPHPIHNPQQAYQSALDTTTAAYEINYSLDTKDRRTEAKAWKGPVHRSVQTDLSNFSAATATSSSIIPTGDKGLAHQRLPQELLIQVAGPKRSVTTTPPGQPHQVVREGGEGSGVVSTEKAMIGIEVAVAR